MGTMSTSTILSSTIATQIADVAGGGWGDRASTPAAPGRSAGGAVALAASSGRDVRIDVLRGLALLVIFVDHVPQNPLSAFTPQALGLSDAAEAFVFMSG